MTSQEPRHIKLRLWLVKFQRVCPVCGKYLSVFDSLHHVFVRRDIKHLHSYLWCKENISLVCHKCHVPEAPRLGYLCTRQKFEMGFSPEHLEEWIDELPTKIDLAPPEFYFEARMDKFGY